MTEKRTSRVILYGNRDRQVRQSNCSFGVHLYPSLKMKLGQARRSASEIASVSSPLSRAFARMSSVKCLSDEAVVYSLSRQSYDELLQKDPHAARLIDLICIRYLSARVQHVSNRIFETRCLPI